MLVERFHLGELTARSVRLSLARNDLCSCTDVLRLIRLFASKCAKCQEAFAQNELFIRTPCYRRYHPDCFRCDHCDRPLVAGDEYYLHGHNQILCRQDFQQLNSSIEPVGTPTAGRVERAAREREARERDRRRKEKRMACVHTDIRSDVTMA